MNIYQKAEKELAELLGWQPKYPNLGYFTENYIEPVTDSYRYADWCDDDSSAFGLMLEYRLSVQCWQHSAGAGDGDDSSFYCEAFDKHNNDKLLATRYAIVLAVIEKLKGEKA